MGRVEQSVNHPEAVERCGGVTTRMRRWECLARLSVRRRGPLLEIRYRCGAGVAEELAVLVAAEQRACRFLSWTLHHVDGQPVVRIEAATGRSEDIAGIAQMVGARAD